MYLFALFVLVLAPSLIIAEEEQDDQLNPNTVHVNQPQNPSASDTARTSKHNDHDHDEHSGHQSQISPNNVYTKCSTGVCFGYPSNCYHDKKDCKYMVAIVKDPSGLYNFTLMRENNAVRDSADTERYVAVGITKVGKQMENSSIVECMTLMSQVTNKHITSSWSAKPADRPYPQTAAQQEEYIIPKEYSSKGNHIICNFQRKPISKVGGNEFNLDKDKYKIILAIGDIEVENQKDGYLVKGKLKFHGGPEQKTTAMSPEFMYLDRKSHSSASIIIQSPLIICLVFFSKLFL